MRNEREKLDKQRRRRRRGRQVQGFISFYFRVTFPGKFYSSI